MNQELLSVKDLSVSFDKNKVVNNVNFDILPGETLAIVGESGSGKSVTALSIMQLLSFPGKITEGQILFKSDDKEPVDLSKLSSARMRTYRGREIAMIFQDPMTSLNPVFTCGSQVEEALIHTVGVSAQEAKKRTLQLFEEVEFNDPEHIFNAYPHEISGGQKQRVMIAMAMICNPSILIADEPTTALDVTVQKTILQLLRNLQIKYRIGIIFISHDLAIVAELADKVGVMFKGEIVEYGSVTSIFVHPKHPYTQGLLASRPPESKNLRRLPTVADFMRDGKENIPFNPFHPSNLISLEERRANRLKFISGSPLFKVENLSVSFTKRSGIFSGKKERIKAVDDVSFEVYQGETLGLVGESGCGKTTLVRSILRLMEPDSGNIWFENQEISSMSQSMLRPLRKDMQLIFQDPYSALNPRIMVGEAIMEPMRVHGILPDEKSRKNRVMELLQRVNLRENYFFRFPHELSGGERQRICIARALALNPKFIIFDESVSSLDVSIQAQVLNLLNDLKRDFNFTYIFISHDLSVVRFMSDRMLIMKSGKIIERGDPDEIYQNPQTEYTKRLLNAIPKISLERIELAANERKALLQTH